MKFSKRHIGISSSDEKYMLDFLGIDKIDTLISKTIPEDIRMNKALNLENEMSESQFLDHIYKQSEKNKHYKNYIGLGYNESVLPPVIQRNILENPGWYTAYTPYQAEIAQGRLEALLNYQTMVSDLTELPISNASLLDEATAAAEAMIMFYNQTKDSSKSIFLVSKSCHPQTIDVLMTRSEPLNIELKIIDIDSFTLIEDTYLFNSRIISSADFFSPELSSPSNCSTTPSSSFS